MATRQQQRVFRQHGSSRAAALEGLPLATYFQRFAGYIADLAVAIVLWFPLELAWRHFYLHQTEIHVVWNFHEIGNLVVMMLYWGLCNYLGNGQTVGKWMARTRVLSLTGETMGAWQSVERTLGYGAAVLEGGLGFLQIFWDPNRMCAQDRLAETIVVDVRKSAGRLPRAILD